MVSHIAAWPGLAVGDRLGDGHRNEVWSGLLDGEPVAVRRSRRSRDSLHWELQLLSQLSDLGFGIAEPVPAPNGALEVDGVVVQRWVVGRPPTEPADWRLVADELQRLHAMTGRIAQRPGCCAVTQLRTHLRSVDADVAWLPDDVRSLVLGAFEQADGAPVSVVHGDPGASNVRIDDDGRVWFLDWDESRVDVCWLDLANLGVVVLDDEVHRRAIVVAHAWEAVNAWGLEPDYAHLRLAALRAATGSINAADVSRVRAAIELQRGRTIDQIRSLERSLAGIVEAAELTSTDDEHDPEGATIAYERAQVSALLRQARDDLVALDESLGRVDRQTIGTCTVCGGPIAVERLLALPGAGNCVRCAQ